MPEAPTEYYTSRYSGEEIDRGVAGGLTMGGAETSQEALYNLGAGVRPNELDNPGLDVNQQGQASYNTLNAPGYGVDRWWSFFANYEVATKTITSVSQQLGAAFRQPIGNPSRFAGKTVTFTVWVLSGSGTMGLTKSTGLNSGLSPLTSLAINGPGVYSVAANIPEDVGGETYPYLLVTVSTPVGGSIQFVSPIPFKLEFGEGQTLAYQDSTGAWQLLPQPDMDYGMQLAKCQAFYEESNENVASRGVSIRVPPNGIIYVPFKVPKRVIPAITVQGNDASYIQTSYSTVNGFTAQNSDTVNLRAFDYSATAEL